MSARKGRVWGGEFHDRQGRRISVGTRVAFNRSGDVCLGEVSEIKPGRIVVGEKFKVSSSYGGRELERRPYWASKPKILVRPELAFQQGGHRAAQSTMEIFDLPSHVSSGGVDLGIVTVSKVAVL